MLCKVEVNVTSGGYTSSKDVYKIVVRPERRQAIFDERIRDLILLCNYAFSTLLGIMITPA